MRIFLHHEVRDEDGSVAIKTLETPSPAKASIAAEFGLESGATVELSINVDNAEEIRRLLAALSYEFGDGYDYGSLPEPGTADDGEECTCEDCVPPVSSQRLLR